MCSNTIFQSANMCIVNIFWSVAVELPASTIEEIISLSVKITEKSSNAMCDILVLLYLYINHAHVNLYYIVLICTNSLTRKYLSFSDKKVISFVVYIHAYIYNIFVCVFKSIGRCRLCFDLRANWSAVIIELYLKLTLHTNIHI